MNVGLAADIGSLQRLPKIVGNDAMARELALTGRRFDAAEAKEMGLIGRVIDGGRNKVIGERAKMDEPDAKRRRWRLGRSLRRRVLSR